MQKVHAISTEIYRKAEILQGSTICLFFISFIRWLFRPLFRLFFPAWQINTKVALLPSYSCLPFIIPVEGHIDENVISIRIITRKHPLVQKRMQQYEKNTSRNINCLDEKLGDVCLARSAHALRIRYHYIASFSLSVVASQPPICILPERKTIRLNK